MRVFAAIVASFLLIVSLAGVLLFALFNPVASLELSSAMPVVTVTSSAVLNPVATPLSVELRASRPGTARIYLPAAAAESVRLVAPSPTATPVEALFVATAPESSPNCGLTMVSGTIRSAEGTALNGVQVRVSWEGVPPDQPLSFPSGPVGYPGRPDGYWDYVLDDQPVANRWYVQVVDAASQQALSEPVTIETDTNDCTPGGNGRQVIRFDWVLTEGQYGIPGAAVTPAPTPTIVPTPTATPTPAPTPLPDGVNRAVKAPILMYHYVSAPPQGSDRIRADLSVSPDNFRAHLAWLRENGYTTISLGELADALAYGAPLPEKPVVLTFDDGYADNYANAFPLLVEAAMRGTFFVVTDLVEERNQAYMTWEQLVEMQQAGMEIGSHTRDHPRLPGKPAEFILSEVQGSAEKIEERLGRRPQAFAYPGGAYDSGVIHLVHQAGYRAAVTTEAGTAHTTGNVLTLKRVRVHGSYTPTDLARVLNYWATRD